MSTITIFGSSHVREEEPDYQTGMKLGRQLARAGFAVCNGGYGGIMEATARGAKEAGGKTIGVSTREFGGPVNRWIGREIKTEKWSERLFKLIGTATGYVVFDGGTGTLVELLVVWEMTNKKFLAKPIVLLGRQSQKLVNQIRKFPHVIDNPHLCLASSPAGAVKLLKSRIERGVG